MNDIMQRIENFLDGAEGVEEDSGAWCVIARALLKSASAEMELLELDLEREARRYNAAQKELGDAANAVSVISLSQVQMSNT